MKKAVALRNILLVGVYLCTLFITPFVSYDPLNVGRFAVIVSLGFGSLASLVLLTRDLLNSRLKIVFIFVGLFISWNLISVFGSKINKIEGFFGITTLNIGAISQISFASVFLLTTFLVNLNLIRRISIALLICGGLSSVYGVIQYLNLDPIDWINPNNEVIGIMGNPNFQSSFVAISLSAAISYLFASSISVKRKVWLVPYFVIGLFNMYWTDSVQGFFVLAAGLALNIYIFVKQKIKSKSGLVLLIGSGIALISSICADLLQIAPWKSIFYSASITYRGDYWRAALNMITENPILGVGPNGFRDNYRTFRDITSATRPAGDIDVTSAHNIFLDMGASGGLPLLIFYLILIFFTLRASINVVKRSVVIDPVFASLFAAWIGFLIQSQISVGILPLMAWGWILSGCLIGYDLLTRDIQVVSDLKLRKTVRSPLVLATACLGIILGFTQFNVDARFRSAVESGDTSQIKESVQLWPQSVSRMNAATRVLLKFGTPDQSLEIARLAIDFNPRNFEAWNEMYLQPNATVGERNRAFTRMKELDPNNSKLNSL